MQCTFEYSNFIFKTKIQFSKISDDDFLHISYRVLQFYYKINSALLVHAGKNEQEVSVLAECIACCKTEIFLYIMYLLFTHRTFPSLQEERVPVLSTKSFFVLSCCCCSQ